MARVLPPFQSLLLNFPRTGGLSALGTTKAFLDAVGGSVRSSFDDAINTCALRMSHALNLSNAEIARTTGVRMAKSADGKLYVYGVPDFTTYMTKTYGAGKQIFDGRKSDSIAAAKTDTGIVIFTWEGKIRDFGATGHTDLFYVMSVGQLLQATCGNHCYFLGAGQPMKAHLWAMS